MRASGWQLPRPKILISAYYCSPFKGSDWRVGWGRVSRAASQFDVVVLTSEQSRQDIERYEAEQGAFRHLQFVYVEEDTGRPRIPYVYIDPFSYGRWQRRAYQVAQELNRTCGFDLVHQVNLIGFREPGELWRLGLPFVWGPVGGTQFFPWRFLSSAGWKNTLLEGCRSVGNAVQLRFSRKVHRALRRSAAVLVANSDGYRAFRRYRADCIQLLETGLDEVSGARGVSSPDEPLKLLWSGELHFRKALHLLLRALPRVKKAIPFKLRILGEGEELARSRKLAAELGVADCCEFMGRLPLDSAMEQSRWADVFVFTSLRDTSGNVMLEAMSYGVPVITFDHQGAGDIVTAESGIKLPVTSPREAVRGIAEAIVALGSDRSYLAALSEGALDRAKHFLWDRNGETMSQVYRSVLNSRVDNQPTERIYASFRSAEL